MADEGKNEGMRNIAERLSERIPGETLADPRLAALTKLLPPLISEVEELGELRLANMDTSPNARRLSFKTQELKEYLAEQAKIVESGFQRSARIQTNMKPDAFSSELRQKFSLLDPGARVKELQSWIKSSDGPAMAAIIDSPDFLSGLTSEEKARYTTQFFEAAVPDLWQLREMYQDAHTHVSAAIEMARNLANEERAN